MKCRAFLVTAMAVAGTSVVFAINARAADDIDIRDAVRRVHDSLDKAMQDLPADATTAMRDDARRRAAERTRDNSTGWRIHVDYTVEDVEFVREDRTAVDVKVENISESAVLNSSIVAKVPVDIGRSIHKGDRIRLTGQVILRVAPLDNILIPGTGNLAAAGLVEVARSADKRPGGGHNLQAPTAWPRWILLVSDPVIERLGAGSTPKPSVAANESAAGTGANMRSHDGIEVIREIEDGLKGAKGEITASRNAAILEAEQKLVANFASLESITISARLKDVLSAKATEGKTQCVVVVDWDRKSLPGGATFPDQLHVKLSAADAATATAGPCKIKITGKPTLIFHSRFAPSKKTNVKSRARGTVLLRSATGSIDHWELLLSDENDSVVKLE